MKMHKSKVSHECHKQCTLQNVLVLMSVYPVHGTALVQQVHVVTDHVSKKVKIVRNCIVLDHK